MTTGGIMTTLSGLTYYSGQSYTVEERFQLHESDYEDFTKFPCILVVDGDETDQNYANGMMRVSYQPKLHFIAENMSVANLKLWRENIQNAIMQSSALWADGNVVMIDSVVVSEENDRKLQHIEFNINIEFDKYYTIT